MRAQLPGKSKKHNKPTCLIGMIAKPSLEVGRKVRICLPRIYMISHSEREKMMKRDAYARKQYKKTGCQNNQVLCEHFLTINFFGPASYFLPGTFRSSRLIISSRTRSTYFRFFTTESAKASAQCSAECSSPLLVSFFLLKLFAFDCTFIGSRVLFATIALLNLIALGANFAANRVLKFEGIKYSNQFVDEDDIVGAPQGIPMAPQDATKITDVFNAQTTNANYGTIEESNPQDEAYDRYVSTNPFR